MTIIHVTHPLRSLKDAAQGEPVGTAVEAVPFCRTGAMYPWVPLGRRRVRAVNSMLPLTDYPQLAQRPAISSNS